MFAGPVFHRELVTAPRRAGFYVARAGYVAALFVLLCTGWLLLIGSQEVRNLGDIARFSSTMFQLLAVLQLALAIFFSALFAASAVAQEKDRRTLVLLLLTDLNNRELVLGKLLAALLNVFVLLLAALPLFLMLTLFGGVSLAQIANVFAVTLATIVLAGSLGSTLALWREKTYQVLAMTVLVLVAWLLLAGSVWFGLWGQRWAGIPCEAWAALFSPWAILEASQPFANRVAAMEPFGNPAHGYLLFAGGTALLLNAFAIWRVRVWNPSREVRHKKGDQPARESIWGAEHDVQHGAPAAGEAIKRSPDNVPVPATSERSSTRAGRAAKIRKVWDQPVIWREICTRAYGKRMLLIRLAYVALFVLAWYGMAQIADTPRGVTKAAGGAILVPIALLSLVLVNAQALISITSERDGRSLDLLLVTDITPKEFVFGKLGGVLYNTKEMVALPLLLCLWLGFSGSTSLENAFFLTGGLMVMYAFVAMLGLHVGMAYSSSRTAIAVSLGTVFFLFLGVAVCMRIMIAFSGSFQVQLMPFMAVMIGGVIGLYVALGARNPSQAIFVASVACPVITFWAITSFLQDMTLGVFAAVSVTYGFATVAMLVPAIDEFDVAMGRTTKDA